MENIEDTFFTWTDWAGEQQTHYVKAADIDRYRSEAEIANITFDRIETVSETNARMTKLLKDLGA